MINQYVSWTKEKPMGSHKTKSSTGASLKAEHITFLRLLLLKVCLNKQTNKKDHKLVLWS